MGDARKTLADELREVAFAAATKEDYLEEDLQGAPLFTPDPADATSDLVEGETQLRSVTRLKGDLRVEGDEYIGEGISRDQIFELSDSADALSVSISDETSALEEVSETPSQGDLYEEYEKLQSDVGISDLKLRAVKDRERGRAVQRDQRLWRECLQLRVSLRSALTASHQLPPEPFRTPLMDSAPHLPSTYEAVNEATRGLMGDLVELQDLRLQGKRKRATRPPALAPSLDLDSLWECLEERYGVLKGFTNETLDRFHRQAMLQTGATTGKGTLQRLHQGISTQVESLMQAPHKALKKACLAIAEQPRILGIPANASLMEDASEVNPEMFVDAEFYQQLSNEYLLSHGMEAVPIVKARKRSRHGESQKRQKAMFTEVHEKLVNFMTPVDWEPPVYAKELSKTLFKQ